MRQALLFLMCSFFYSVLLASLYSGTVKSVFWWTVFVALTSCALGAFLVVIIDKKD